MYVDRTMAGHPDAHTIAHRLFAEVNLSPTWYQSELEPHTGRGFC